MKKPRTVDVAKDVADFQRRERFAQERQEEFWRERIRETTAMRLSRDTLASLAEVLGIPERPPAEWRSPREREIDDIEEERRGLAAREAALRASLHRLETP